MAQRRKQKTSPARSNVRWTNKDRKTLQEALNAGLSTKQTATMLNRSPQSVACKKSEMVSAKVIKSSLRFPTKFSEKTGEVVVAKRPYTKRKVVATPSYGNLSILEKILPSLKTHGLKAKVEVNGTITIEA